MGFNSGFKGLNHTDYSHCSVLSTRQIGYDT